MKMTIHKLEDLCTEIIGGGTPSTSNERYWEGEIPWISSADINDKGIITPKRFISQEAVAKSATNLVPKGTLIVVTRVGVGKAGIAPCDLCFSQDSQGLILKTNLAYSRYCQIALKSELKRLATKARGSTIKGVTKKELGNLKIPLPESLPDQIRIATLLSRAEALIEKRRESLRLLDELVKGVFLEMFGDVDKGDMPLGRCLKITHGAAFKSSDFVKTGIPVIKIGTVNKGFFDLSSFSFLPVRFKKDFSKYIILPGDLLISLTGTVGKDDYANTCFVTSDYPEYFLNQRVAKLLPIEGVVEKYFLHYLFSYPPIKRKLVKADRGVRQANLSNGDIYNLQINLPPLPLQTQFAAIVQQVETLKAKYQASLAELENLYGSLSGRAFLGELDLSGMEVEEEMLAFAHEEMPVTMEPSTLLPNYDEIIRRMVAVGEISAAMGRAIASLGQNLKFDQTLLDAIPKSITLWDNELINTFQNAVQSYIELLRRGVTFDVFQEMDGSMDYEIAKQELYRLLKKEKPFLKQEFDMTQKQMIFRLHETD